MKTNIVLVITACLIFSGCSFLQPEPVQEKIIPLSFSIKFKAPIIVKTPLGEPGTVKEHILCGLFYFDHQRFKQASNEFEQASKLINNQDTGIFRACLASEAICHLLSNNKAAFTANVEQLKSTYSKYELINTKLKDSRNDAILNICCDIKKEMK